MPENRGAITAAVMGQSSPMSRGGPQFTSNYNPGFTSFAPAARPPQAAATGGSLFAPPPASMLTGGGGGAPAASFAPPPPSMLGNGPPMSPAMTSGGFTAQAGQLAVANPAGANALMAQQKAAMPVSGSPEAAAHRAAMAAKYPASYWDNLMAQRAKPQTGPGSLFAPPPMPGTGMPTFGPAAPAAPPAFKSVVSPGAAANPGGVAMRGRGY